MVYGHQKNLNDILTSKNEFLRAEIISDSKNRILVRQHMNVGFKKIVNILDIRKNLLMPEITSDTRIIVDNGFWESLFSVIRE